MTSNFIIYKSSAGSGKTFTLVKEYLRIALGDSSLPPTAYKGILAVTFTNKAAAEMKERVVKTLQKLSMVDTTEPMMNLLREDLQLTKEEICKRAENLLNAVLHNYTEFSIGTIDSFVHRIVRTFAVDLKLPMNFGIESKYEKIIALCVDELMKTVGEDPVITKVLMEFTRLKVEEDKAWQVDEEVVKFVKKLLDETGVIHLRKIKNLGVSDFLAIKDSLQKFIFLFRSTLKTKGESVVLYIEQAGLTDKDFYGAKGGIWNYFQKIKKGDLGNEIVGKNVLKTIEEGKWNGQKTVLSHEIIEFLKNSFKDIESFRTAQIEKYFTYEAIYKNIYSLVIVTEIEKLVEAYKQDNNIIFISEFNKKISEIVLNEPVPFIFERLGEKYKHFLLDEFQDTSVLQWQNLLPLVDNSLANGNFNLIVGDGKQSIYRWRGGEVEQFTELPKIFGFKNKLILEREQSLERNYHEKYLETNYRSKKVIVEFNNKLYDYLKNTLLPDKFKKVYDKHIQKYKLDTEEGYVSFDLITEKDSKLKDILVCEKTYFYILKTIAKYDYDYSDITILVRNKKEGKIIADFLLYKKIPIVSSESLQIFLNEGVGALLAALHLVSENSSNTHEAIIINYLVKKNTIIDSNFSSLWESFSTSGKSFGAWLYEKFNIDIRRFKLNGLPIYEMCTNIASQLKIEESDSFFLRFFLDEVLSYTKQHKENLKAFLDWCTENSDKSAVLPAGTDAVSIMTIHASKGLEFSVVIMPFADWQFNKTDFIWVDLNEPELPDLKTMIASTAALSKTPYNKASEEEKNKQKLDNVNLLYVATTRAINHLHIISRNRNNSGFTDKWLIEFFKYNFNATEDFFDLGEMQINQVQKKHLNTAIEEKLFLRDWKDLVKIKFTDESYPEFDLINEKRESGILFHLAMSKIFVKGQEQGATKYLSKNGLCSEKEAIKIQNKITNLFLNPSFDFFFQKHYLSLNEPEIILTNKKIYRPDRVIFFLDYVAVLDYKTGSENMEHDFQITKYAHIIEGLGHSLVKKYIVYVDEERVEEVF